MTPRRRLFIASIGNKAPYRQTRHSAGHLLLDAVKPLLASTHGDTSAFHETWYSPSYMNESGPKLVRALENWRQTATSYPTTLIILHDELEAPLGKLRVKRGGPEAFSLRGHRGLISVCESLRGKGLWPAKAKAGDGEMSILRVGVGIGRPTSRENNAVADYVLTAVSERELKAYHAAAGEVVKVIGEELEREVE